MRKTIVALDDEPLALVLIEKYIQEIQGWELKAAFTDSVEALEFIKSHSIDLILSDINMPDMSGLEFINALPKTERPLIIFITAYKEHAVESYELDVLDYLVKPVSIERFEKALNKAEEWASLKNSDKLNNFSQDKDFLMVYSEYQLVKLNLAEIIYIQSMGDYVKIHLGNNHKPVMTLERLKNIENKLGNKGFIRVHRSYVVNKEKITAFQKAKIQLKDDWVPVSQTYAKKLETLLG